MPEVVGRLRTPRQASAPSSPVAGEMYYDTAQAKLYWYNGSAWLPASGADVVYNGAHPTNSPYTPGDVVVSNGVAYMAVKPTSAVPTAWPQVPPYPDTTGKTGQILTAVTSGAAPAWQAPAPQGADLVYNGDFPANTPYTDGDIVVGSDGVVYMCVTPTSSAPTAWPGGPTLAPTPKPPYGTTLPASPIDGQEAVLVDSVTNPTYQWRFRYNAGSSSAYKWECIGGAPAAIEPANYTLPAANGWYGVPGAITCPRAGEYLLHGVARFVAGAVSAQDVLTFSLNGTPQQVNYMELWFSTGSTQASTLTIDRRYALAATATVALGGYSGAARVMTAMFISMLPVRVS